MHRIENPARVSLALVSLALVACVPNAKDVGALDGGETEADGGTDGSTPDEAGSDGPGGSGPVADDGPSADDAGAVPSCAEDVDGDQVPIDEDDAPGVFDPAQGDQDGDGIADVEDLCPTVSSLPASDSDRDGFGNACDPCRNEASTYHIDGIPDYMQVRNIPGAQDFDGDGIGDACDTCVQVADCGAFGPGDPWAPSDGDPLVDPACQADDDGDGIGDACEGVQAPDAAGPVGFGPADDFDQDGLRNDEDGCPRLPVDDAVPCELDEDCGPFRRCESTGRCDHLDTDHDDVGDVCDTCPNAPNPAQTEDGFAQEDDWDGDFVGNACELGDGELACSSYRSPARVGFYPVSAGGWCCTLAWDGRAILDPWGVPVDPDCTDAQASAGACVSPPITSLHGLGQFALPAGCDAALADAGIGAAQNLPLTASDAGSLDELWPYACRMPLLDQDFDGVADECDLCPHAFDPSNLPYVDAEGTLWPNDGKYCNGAWAVESCDEGG